MSALPAVLHMLAMLNNFFYNAVFFPALNISYIQTLNQFMPAVKHLLSILCNFSLHRFLLLYTPARFKPLTI
jgi:hypothetical protein